MAVNVQNDTGTTASANSYVSLVDFKAFCADRGLVISAYSDATINGKLIQSCDYIDMRWTYIGTKYDEDQTTEFPREILEDGVYENTEIFANLVKAACLYTYYALSNDLIAISISNTEGNISSIKEKVGAIESNISYAGSSGGNSYPIVPAADNLLRPYILNTNYLERS